MKESSSKQWSSWFDLNFDIKTGNYTVYIHAENIRGNVQDNDYWAFNDAFATTEVDSFKYRKIKVEDHWWDANIGDKAFTQMYNVPR